MTGISFSKPFPLFWREKGQNKVAIKHLCEYYITEVLIMCLQYYTIRPGDTLYVVARRFNTTVERLLELNSGIDPENLQVGRSICVREGSAPVSCPFGTIPYTIIQGDTLAAIAARFSTTVDSLLEANPDVNPLNLQVGQRICISQPIGALPDCPFGNYYVIRRGDTIRSIAAAFEVEQREILTANPGIVPGNLQIGQVICLPVAPSPIEIIVNISAKRLTVYRNGRVFRQYVVATGKEETPTPTGVFTVINKQVDPGGPYGTRWLGLSLRGYGIHGTNDPSSIGKSASNGCVRMFNEDVEELFSLTPVGTVVRILP